MPGPMLYETPPDRWDGHTHQVQLDESGDGLTSEGGPLPHVHEAQGGVVLAARQANYVSDHPGDLVPLEGEQQPMPNDQMMPPDQMQGAQQQGGQMGPPPGAGGPMGEGKFDPAVDAILYEGVDPLEIAESFLLG